MSMLFAPAELYPYDWWQMRGLTLWRMRAQSEECFRLRAYGEMVYLNYHCGDAYRRYKDGVSKIECMHFMIGQAYGL